MKRPKTLNARFVETAQPGRYGDGHGGHGLSLLVKPMANGRLSKSWSQRIKIGSQRTHIGLGSYPLVTLAAARAKALENRRAVLEGADPRKTPDEIPTFAQAAETVITLHAQTWKNRGKSEKQWRASLRDYAMPQLGSKRVSEISSGDILAALIPIWNSKRETARRVRGRIATVMKWAIAEGHRADNPAGDSITAALPRGGRDVKHLRALPYQEVGAAVAAVRGAQGAYLAARLCFHFMTLTAVRSGEARGAQWSEIDLEKKTWNIPANRMKAGRAHRVPLSDAALQILNEACVLRDDSGLCFPSYSGRTLSDSTMSRMLRQLHIDAVPHGFRSSFRQWAAEMTNFPSSVCEEALAHQNKNRVEAAYQRSDLVERRCKLMDAWASYLAVKSAEIVAFR